MNEGTSDDLSERISHVLVPSAVGQLIAGVESLWSLRAFGPDGLLRGRSSEQRGVMLPRSARRVLDSTAGAAVIHVMTVSGAVMVLTSRGKRRRQLLGTAIGFAGNRLLEIRNPYGRDGSDQMAGVIAAYRLVTASIPDERRSDDLFLRAVNAQTCIAYVASGLAKLISSTWRSGDALGGVLRTRIYGGTWIARAIVSRPRVAQILTWGTIAWECAFPLVYVLKPRPAGLVLTCIKGFHLAVAMSMGLPRFLWGFSSAHSAVGYVVDRRR